MSATLNTPNSTPNDDGHVWGHTRRLCRDIKNLFHHRRQYDASSSVAPSMNSDSRRKLIEETARWIDCLVDQRARSSLVSCKQTIVDALVSLLRTLDDVDIENLQFLSSRWRGAARISEGKRVNDKLMNQCPNDDSALNKRGRRRLPPNIRSMDVVRAMHDAEAATTHSDNHDDNDADDEPKLNSDRSKRAKKMHMECQQHSCSTMGISMKDVMKAQIPKEDTSQMPISTLTHDAAVLRRDLYLSLIHI